MSPQTTSSLVRFSRDRTSIGDLNGIVQVAWRCLRLFMMSGPFGCSSVDRTRLTAVENAFKLQCPRAGCGVSRCLPHSGDYRL
jgi:hypothetical protein